MKTTLIILTIILLISCKDSSTSLTIDDNAAITEVIPNKPLPKKVTDNKGTYLCKINGKPWHYTKASGLVSRHRKTKKKDATFTFTKKLDKGSEVVQLFYDGDSYQLDRAAVHLKVPKTPNGKMTAMYIYHPNTMKNHPNAQISGTIDLSNPMNASGKAQISELDVRYDKENVKYSRDKIVTVTDINFEGVGYSSN